MDVNNEGDRGGNPGDTAPQNVPDFSKMTVEEKAAYEQQLDKRLSDKSTQVAQLTEVAQKLTTDIQGKRGDRRGNDLLPDSQRPPKQKEKQNEDDPDADPTEPVTHADLNRIRDEDKKQKYVNTVGEGWLRFAREHAEYSEENDIGGVKYEKLKNLARRTYLGDSVEEVYDTLSTLHNGLFGASKKTEQETLGIGDTDSIPREKNKNKVDWMTIPLNSAQQKAAQIYIGGEKAYREQLAKKAAKGE